MSPLLQTIKAKGEDKEIKVDASDKSCKWTAQSPVDWITITRNASGTGDGDVRYDVERNRGLLPRIATLTVAGKSVLITQLGTLDGDDENGLAIVEGVDGSGHP